MLLTQKFDGLFFGLFTSLIKKYFFVRQTVICSRAQYCPSQLALGLHFGVLGFIVQAHAELFAKRTIGEFSGGQSLDWTVQMM